jgi:hypothetical protein
VTTATRRARALLAQADALLAGIAPATDDTDAPFKDLSLPEQILRAAHAAAVLVTLDAPTSRWTISVDPSGASLRGLLAENLDDLGCSQREAIAIWQQILGAQLEQTEHAATGNTHLSIADAEFMGVPLHLFTIIDRSDEQKETI